MTYHIKPSDDMFVPADINLYYRVRSVFFYIIKMILHLPTTLSSALLSCVLLFRLSSPCKRRLIKLYHENERKGSLWENTYIYACILFSNSYRFLRNTNVYSLWHHHLALLFWYHSGGPQDLGLALKREWEQFLYWMITLMPQYSSFVCSEHWSWSIPFFFKTFHNAVIDH